MRLRIFRIVTADNIEFVFEFLSDGDELFDMPIFLAADSSEPPVELEMLPV